MPLRVVVIDAARAVEETVALRNLLLVGVLTVTDAIERP